MAGPRLDVGDRPEPLTDSPSGIDATSSPLFSERCAKIAGMGVDHQERSQNTLNDLLAVIQTCRRLLPILNELKNTRPGMGPRQSNIGRYKPESKEPWAAEAAHIYFAIYFDSRVLADRMRGEVGIGSYSWVGSGDGLNQVEAVATLVPHRVLQRALWQVEGWARAGLQIRDIDQEDGWTPIPRLPGQRPTFCPFCSTLSLRVNRRRGIIKCFLPGCHDTADRPTQARMEYGPALGQGILVFDDGTTVRCQTERIEG